MFVPQNLTTGSLWAIVVKKPDGTAMGHVPDGLAFVIQPMMLAGEITKMSGVVTGGSRPAPEGTWRPGGGVEIPCKYHIYSLNEHQQNM